MKIGNDVDSFKNMAASDGSNGSSWGNSPQKMAVCAWAGETQTFRVTDLSCHNTPCHVHSVFLSTVPAFCGILHLGLLRLIWSHFPHCRAFRCPWELGPGGKIHSHGDPVPGAWRWWEIGIRTPGKGYGWPSSGWECRKMKLAMTAAGFSAGVHAGAGWDASLREQFEGTSR